MRKAGSTQKWVKEEQSLNFFFLTKNNSGKHISRENCLKTFTVHHIHQDWFWLVDTAESACSDASNFIGMLHKNLYKKVSIDGARKERVRWRKSKRGREKQILRNRDNRNTYLSSTEISAVCRQNVRVWEVGLHYFLFRITCALSTFPWLWCGSWSLRMLSIEKTWRSDMRNVMRKKRLEPGLTLSQQERESERNIWLTCWKLKYVSQFPQLPLLDKWPFFHFPERPTWAVSIQNATYLFATASVTSPTTLPWQNYNGGIQNKMGRYTSHLAGMFLLHSHVS